MASAANLKTKKEVVKEIVGKIQENETVIIFSYQGLTVESLSVLRRQLRETDAEIKVYKNTLLKIALDELKIDLDEFMAGPNAVVFGKKLLEPIKALSDFSKKNPKLEIRVGIISGDIADLTTISEYANIPSREGLLTMLAGGMIQYVRDLSIGLNLYAEQLNDGQPVVSEEPKQEEVKEENIEETVIETVETEEVVETTEEN